MAISDHPAPVLCWFFVPVRLQYTPRTGGVKSAALWKLAAFGSGRGCGLDGALADVALAVGMNFGWTVNSEMKPLLMD